MENNTILQINHVSFSFDEELVLDDINLKVARGEFLGIIGPNGSGKTTLLKIILGLLKPRSGSVHLFGENIQNFKDRSKIGYVPQKAGSSIIRYPLTVEEIVAMGTEDKEAIVQALKSVDMEKHRKRLISKLSGGQQQRVFIARALALQPELLILDEPTVGVDIDSQAKFYKLLRDLNQESALTLILVSHDVGAVAHEVNTLACINSKLICHGNPRDLLKENILDKVYGKDLRFVLHGTKYA